MVSRNIACFLSYSSLQTLTTNSYKHTLRSSSFVCFSTRQCECKFHFPRFFSTTIIIIIIIVNYIQLQLLLVNKQNKFKHEQKRITWKKIKQNKKILDDQWPSENSSIFLVLVLYRYFIEYFFFVLCLIVYTHTRLCPQCIRCIFEL